MLIKLERFSYSDTETEGVLRVGSLRLATIEQPWVPNPNGSPGGKPFQSCIPDGMYRLTYFERPNGDDAYIIYNPDLGVYRSPHDVEAGKGRYLCLFHKANWAHQVHGCVAPGMRREALARPMDGFTAPAVRSSGTAMGKLVGQLGKGAQHLLSITSVVGASDVRV